MVGCGDSAPFIKPERGERIFHQPYAAILRFGITTAMLSTEAAGLSIKA
jgi:hypothetical protein